METLLRSYAWALWLATPVIATVAASLATWWQGRSRRTSPARAARDHERYLEALGRAAGSAGSTGSSGFSGRPVETSPSDKVPS